MILDKAELRFEKAYEWAVKFLTGIGIGLVLYLIFLFTGSFKSGLRLWQVPLAVLMLYSFGIGFSFGLFVLKLTWRCAKNISKRVHLFVGSTTGNFILTTAIFIFLTFAALGVSWILGLVICIGDALCAALGTKLISVRINERFGYLLKQPDNINKKAILAAAVERNYRDHGNANAGYANDGRGFNPTQQQVEDAVNEKMNEW